MFFVYILKCSDNSLYTGSTNNLTKRIHQHNHTKNGAHYTKIRRPVILVYKENHLDIGSSRKREAEIKRLTKEEKVKLIEENKN